MIIANIGIVQRWWGEWWVYRTAWMAQTTTTGDHISAQTSTISRIQWDYAKFDVPLKISYGKRTSNYSLTATLRTITNKWPRSMTSRLHRTHSPPLHSILLNRSLSLLPLELMAISHLNLLFFSEFEFNRLKLLTNRV